MRLNTIKLAGFKSFVDATKIPFLKPLTAIVGPNGCGKSNVIDAVRWVLGESSAKHLRGESMTDVIFNGSSGRRPVSVASVELVFDNPDGRLGGQYASYQSIAVKRQVDRQGESSYFLNGQKCRRKDITELFLGTGLGARSYAIIEQGTISRLIESKPQELRVFIEEAAGISRYKERRRDTETRIRHTRENLDRLADIRHELGSQLEKLAAQSEAALSYRELKRQERQGLAELLLIQYQGLLEQAEQYQQLLLESQTEVAAAKTQWQALELSLTELNITKGQVERQEQQLVADNFRIATELARLGSQLEFQQRQHSQDKQRLAELNANRDLWLQQSKAAQTSHQVLMAEQQSLHQLSEQQQTQLLSLEKDVSLAEKALAGATHTQQQWQHSLSELQLKQQLAANKRSYQEQHRLEKQRALTAVIEQLGTSQSQTLASSIESLSAGLTLQQELRTELAQQLEDAEYKQGAALQQLVTVNGKVSSEQQKLAALQSRSDLITQLLAKAKPAGNDVSVWQVTQVDSGWEKAAELVLEPVLQQGVLNGLDISSDDVAPNTDGIGFQLSKNQDFGMLSSQVNLAPWLTNLEFVLNKADALARLATLSASEQQRQRYVTQAGELIGQGFCLNAKTHSQPMQLMAQAHELDECIAQCEQQLIVLKQQQQHFDDAKRLQDAQVAHLQAQVQQQQLVEQKLAQDCLHARSQFDKEQDQWTQQQGLQMSLQQELAELDDELARFDLDANALSEQLIYQEQQLMQAQRALEQHQHLWQQSKLVWQQEQHSSQQAHSQSLQHQTAVALSEQSQQALTERLNEVSAEIAALYAKSANQDSALSHLPELEQQHQACLQQQSQLQSEIVVVRAQLASLQAEIDTKLLQQKQVIGKIEQLSARLNQQQLKREGIQGQLQGQLSRLQEAEIALDSEITSDISIPKRQQQLDDIRQQIGLLGAINLAAIEEYDQQAKRKQYLDEQDNDLRTAMASLEEAIRKIDKETKSRFKETFDQINGDFSRLFPKVFGGGSAYLALTDDDLLETGVSIMAQPPGKKNSTIHLLSGGEKALTALSLVFAIFRLNPAPFCMLDEVDAPLDDANVERFCRLLKEMSQTVQFIYISHNKITMEMADQLTGVTMHEPGVSRIVAVDIEEAVAMADAG